MAGSARSSFSLRHRAPAHELTLGHRCQKTCSVDWSNDVVFTSTFDGALYGLAADDGRVLWHTKLRAGVNACPAVAGKQLFAGAGIPREGSVEELVALEPV